MHTLGRMLDAAFLTRAEAADLIRWKADAARAGMQFGPWTRLALNKAGGRLPAVKAAEPVVRVVEGEPVRTETAAVGSGRVGEVSSGELATQRERARMLAMESGKCTADVERGVRCRFCGKVHE